MINYPRQPAHMYICTCAVAQAIPRGGGDLTLLPNVHMHICAVAQAIPREGGDSTLLPPPKFRIYKKVHFVDVT